MTVTLDEGTNHGYRTCVSLICRVCCPGLDPAGRCLTVRRKVAHTLLGLHRTAAGVSLTSVVTTTQRAMFGAGGISPERMSPSTIAPTIAAIAPPMAVSEA